MHFQSTLMIIVPAKTSASSTHAATVKMDPAATDLQIDIHDSNSAQLNSIRM
jgi:hypothetical protein